MWRATQTGPLKRSRTTKVRQPVSSPAYSSLPLTNKDRMSAFNQAPIYEALDSTGKAYTRRARVIHELPSPTVRLAALGRATPALAVALGIPAMGMLRFGEPVFRAFGFTNVRQVRGHRHEALLLTQAADLPLIFAV